MNSCASSAITLHAIAVGVVLPAKAHDRVVEVEEPVVGDGHAVGIAAQIVEHLRGTGEGTFGVHDPSLLAELLEPRREGRGFGERREGARETEGPLREGTPEGIEILAAKDHGEGADREEKSGGRGDPARAVGGERAPGDDTMQVQMLGEILPPGVQNRRAPEVPAEMAGIAREGGERVGHGVEEQRVDHAGIPLGERVERMR
jgi:hypothetical protein